MFSNKKNICLLAAIVSSFGSVNTVIAEDVPTVVVSATRSQQSSLTIPGNIKVISRAEIEARGATSVAEAINGVAGVHVSDLFGDGSNASISMRGFGATSGSNVLVIVDGRRLNNIDLSSPDLNAVSVKDIEQIEIIQGGAGVLYGDQAVAGVVNIITRKPQAFTVDAQLQTGSYNRTRLVGRVSDKLDNKLSYVVSGESLRSDNYRENNEIDNTNLLGRLDYELPEGSIFTEVQRVTKTQGLPGPLTEAEVEDDRRQPRSFTDFVDEETEVARLGIESTISEDWALEVELAKRDFESTSQFSGSPYSIESNQLEFTPRLIANFPMKDGQAIVTMGVDYLDADYETYSENEYQAKAVYLQAVLPISDRANMTIGGRKAEVENKSTSFGFTEEYDDSVSAVELGVQGNINPDVSVFVRYDENFRFAKIDELSFATPGVILETQTGESKEIGVEWKVEKYSASMQVFRLEFENELAYDPGADGPFGPGTGANVNLDPTLHDGFIVETGYIINSDWNMNAAFTYNDAVFDQGANKGNKISGVPERQLSLNTTYRLSGGFKTYAEAIHVDDHYVSGDDANLFPKLDSYTIVNANLSYQWDEFMISARINNLFDEEYSSTAVESFGSVYFYPSPDRSFWLMASVRFD